MTDFAVSFLDIIQVNIVRNISDDSKLNSKQASLKLVCQFYGTLTEITKTSAAD